MTNLNYAVVAISDTSTGSVFLTKRATTLRTHAGEYCFPGGRRESGETLIDTAVRELKEETGIDSAVLNIKPRHTSALPQQATTYTSNKTFAVIYATVDSPRTITSVLKLNPDEVESAKWFNPRNCTIVDDHSSRGLIRVIDTTDHSYIEGATAEIVANLFTRQL